MSEPVVELAVAIEKCLTDLAAAVGEFRNNYSRELRRPVSIPPEVASAVMKVVATSEIEWLSTEEAAEIIGIDEQTLRA